MPPASNSEPIVLDTGQQFSKVVAHLEREGGSILSFARQDETHVSHEDDEAVDSVRLRPQAKTSTWRCHPASVKRVCV